MLRRKIWVLASLLFGQLALAGTLPEGLKWETEVEVPPIGDPAAEKGGTIKIAIPTFPLTLRHVGPDANTVLYMSINHNRLGLVDFHPNTNQPIAMLATSWAEGPDGKSVYYKLDPAAKWSDGEPVKAEDFAFILDFYRSKEITDPWYNNYYTKELTDVEIIDASTIRVVLPAKKPNLLYHTAIAPLPKHFYGGKVGKDFVERYNWKVEPNTGPYIIDESSIKKGRSVAFERKKDWWAKDKPFFKGRFNVDKILYKVVRDQTVQWENFKTGGLDFFGLEDPLYWHEKAKTEVFEKGYAERLWFYTDRPMSCFGIWMNTASPVFRDQKVRQAVAHATNVEHVMNTILRGEAERMETCHDGYGKYTNPNLKAAEFNLAKVDELFNQAGFQKRGGDGIRVNDKGEKLEFRLMFSYDGHKEKLVPIVEDMKKAGIHMILEQKDWSAQIKMTNANKHEAVYSGFGPRDFGVPDFYSIFHSDNANKPNSNNNSNIADKVLSDDIEAYSAATDEGERIKLAHKIQQRIHDLAILVPGYKFPWFRTGYWRWWRFPKVAATKKTENPFEPYDPARGGLFWFDSKIHAETEAAQKASKSLTPVVHLDETYRSLESKKKAQSRAAEPKRG